MELIHDFTILNSFDLHVTNIDPSLGDWKGIRQALLTSFGEHVSVRGLWVFASQDGCVSAIVRVSNKEQAHFAVAQLHRRKIGNKRIFISFEQGSNIDQQTLKKEVASLLQDVPNYTLPLFKFREMFEKRYRRSVSSSDLYRMKDVVFISESSSGGNVARGSNFGTSTVFNNGRMISLCGDWKNKEGDGLALYCKLHPPKMPPVEKCRTGWAEKEVEVNLPKVSIELKLLRSRVHSLLHSHTDGLPLLSFLDCYEAEFEEMEKSEDGVPLEHLVTCIQGVEISYAENGMKRIQWSEKKDSDNFSQPLAVQLAQLSRELMDLLKTFSRCSLPFSKLIPAYHHHFGRQCRVADYGHFSLSALLQTLPQTIQIMGEAQHRILTLAHRAQMKRFATDVLRVLKGQGGVKKQVNVEAFPETFTQMFPNRQFCPQDYGLCYFADLISELVENSTLVASSIDEEGNTVLSIPKREQTATEIHRTRVFASEVVDLLRHSIRCELPFSKFIPSYHHHFGRQCRVSDYGFSKLTELFEAIGNTTVVTNHLATTDCTQDDKILRLTSSEQLKVVGDQLRCLVEKRNNIGLSTLIYDLDELFMNEYGFFLCPDFCGASDLTELVTFKLHQFIQVDGGDHLVLVDQSQADTLIRNAKILLENHPGFSMDLEDFSRIFKCNYQQDINEDSLKDMPHLIISENETGRKTIGLSPLWIFALEISQLIERNGGFIHMVDFENIYFQEFGRPLQPTEMGYNSLANLLEAIPEVICFKGRHSKRVIVLRKDTPLLVENQLEKRNSPVFTNDPGFQLSINNNSNNNKLLSNSIVSPRHCHNNNTNNGGNGNQDSSPSPRWNKSNKKRNNQQSLYSASTTATRSAGGGNKGNIFTFENRPVAISPPVYDMWMQDTTNAGSPPVSPPVVWTYHPIVYPPPSPPGGPAGNVMLPAHFSYGGPWSPPPMTSACFERLPYPQQTISASEFGKDLVVMDGKGWCTKKG